LCGGKLALRGGKLGLGRRQVACQLLRVRAGLSQAAGDQQ
jgi:hypothetical protein